jgi:exodeoxyribonuclease V beta subunit
MQTRSYTSLESRRLAREHPADPDVEEFKYDLEPAVEGADLRGGRRVGIFLHEVIEKLELETFDLARDLAGWRQLDAVKRIFIDAMRRHQLTDDRWLERGTEIVFNVMTSRIATLPGKMVGPLYKCPNVREMEFVYPIPERSHSLLAAAGDERWSVDRGYLKGFVDFVFEYEGKHYFADWKSDALAAYGPGAIAPHVKEHYDLQAQIYSVGIVRLLGIRNEQQYNQRFGGLLYLFIRGIRRDGAGDAGVYFHRPDWAEICRYERGLIGVIPTTGAVQ